MGIPADLTTDIDKLVENLNFAHRENPIHFRRMLGSTSTIVGVLQEMKFHIVWDTGDQTWLCTTTVLGSSFGLHAHTPMMAFRDCVRRVQEHLRFVADHTLSTLAE